MSLTFIVLADWIRSVAVNIKVELKGSKSYLSRSTEA